MPGDRESKGVTGGEEEYGVGSGYGSEQCLN